MKRYLLAAFLLAPISFALAQGKATYLTRPFDVSVETLPANFKGHNCAAIASKLKPLRIEKSEFESQADFEQRSARAATEATPGGGLSAESLLAFPLEDLAVEMRYNAEQKEASVFLHEAWIGYAAVLHAVGMPRRSTVLNVQRVAETREPFVGSNAFGVKVRAERIHRKVCAIGLPDFSPNRLVIASHLTAQLEPDAAKALKENLGAVLIGRIAAPIYATAFKSAKATIDSPREVRVDADVIVIEPVELWYYNKKTGAVAGKLKPER